ncbi:tripartite tricarboxylate transporter substrate binding protein [Pigmentiphaga daeguensis]|uniref:Tripartite tricarboxylate transporter substrate binding protein n=1 Tax=Pigmentiphaga daeguensis TaxID=414049 RepID=A0ABN1CGK1_9BURK
MKRILFRGLLLAAAAVVLPAHAQHYPSKPVKIVVPFPPGALTDTLARLLAGRLQEKWGQSVIVDNRAGASGNIGTESVFRSDPDGHTLLFTPQAPLVIAKLLNPKLAFDPDRLAPVAVVTRSTVVVVANPKTPFTNIRQLIDYAKANPGRLNFASTGFGSTAHLSNELLFEMSGIKGVNVPYQGITPASTALQAGEVDVLFDAMGHALTSIQAGKLRILAVAGAARSDALPDVPTVAETLPGFLSTLWTGVVAPPGTPAGIVNKISADIAEALKHPEFAGRIDKLNGIEAVGSTPAEMNEVMREERERWARVIRVTGVKTE